MARETAAQRRAREASAMFENQISRLGNVVSAMSDTAEQLRPRKPRPATKYRRIEVSVFDERGNSTQRATFDVDKDEVMHLRVDATTIGSRVVAADDAPDEAAQ